MEAIVPNLNLKLQQKNTMSDYEIDDLVDIIDNISEGSSQVFSDNENAFEDIEADFISMAQIQDDNEVDKISGQFRDSDEEQLQTAGSVIETQYDSMQGFLTQSTVKAEEDHDNEISEQQCKPDTDEENQQKKRIHAKLQSLHESHEQDRDQTQVMKKVSV